ncbi:hypothetical protein RUND412_010426, partial [Rhizina undulata]
MTTTLLTSTKSKVFRIKGAPATSTEADLKQILRGKLWEAGNQGGIEINITCHLQRHTPPGSDSEDERSLSYIFTADPTLVMKTLLPKPLDSSKLQMKEIWDRVKEDSH